MSKKSVMVRATVREGAIGTSPGAKGLKKLSASRRRGGVSVASHVTAGITFPAGDGAAKDPA